MRRTPYISGCAQSGDVTSYQHRVQRLHSYDTNKKKIKLLLAQLVLDSKTFGKGNGFLNSAEASSQKDFCAMMH